MFKPSSFKTALSFPNHSIHHFDSRIKQQKTLLQTIRAALPEMLASHVQHCLLNGKKLLIYTDSAAWAAQLRFYEKTLLACIEPVSNNNDTIVQIKLAIEPVGPSRTHEDTAIIPAPEKLEAIRHFCLAVPDNELTIALLKLTETLKRKRSDESNQ